MASGDIEPSLKKRKIDVGDNIFDYFFNCEEYDTFIETFTNVMTSLSNALIPAVVLSCDGAINGRLGKPFNRCDCEVQDVRSQLYFFGAFFEDAMKILNKLKTKTIPNENNLKKASLKLLKFCLKAKDWHEELQKIMKATYIKDETQVMVTLAEHFFNQLTVCKGYVMDKHAKKETICKCGLCSSENLNFDDTSIGNKTVWHGNVDVLFESCDVPVSVQIDSQGSGDSDESEESLGGRSCTDVKTIESIDNIQHRSQVIAQAIVFAFLQKKRHPSWKHFLLPTIITNNKEFRIYFYDPEYDILLQSKKYFFINTNIPIDSLDYEATIVAWLVLNHKILCSGPYEEFVTHATRSNFKKAINDISLHVYENELQFKNVMAHRYDENCPQPLDNNFWLYASTYKKFSWPSSVQKLE